MIIVELCLLINLTSALSCCPALPLQTDSQSLGKDLLTPNDSAVTDLSCKTDSSPKSETPSKTEDSSKTDVRPCTPGSGGSPQPKKGHVASLFHT